MMLLPEQISKFHPNAKLHRHSPPALDTHLRVERHKFVAVLKESCSQAVDIRNAVAQAP
jgi:hypothetical protein